MTEIEKLDKESSDRAKDISFTRVLLEAATFKGVEPSFLARELMRALELAKKIQAEKKEKGETLSLKEIVLSYFDKGSSLREKILSYFGKGSRRSKKQAGLIKTLLEFAEKAREARQEDPLTGVGNREKLIEKFDDFLKENRTHNHERQEEETLCFMFIDLDNFGSINDLWGHSVGDSILIRVAKILKEEIRDSDDIYRYGGDEFVILFLTSDPEAGKVLLERIKDIFNDLEIEVSEKVYVKVKASIGFSACKRFEDRTAEAILFEADQNMYRAKNRKKIEAKENGNSK